MIICTPFNRSIALNPVSGEERWFFEADVALDNWMPYNCRGVVAWDDREAAQSGACRWRIYFGTNDARLFSIDARSGKQCADFGENGEVTIEIGTDEMIRGEVRIFGGRAPH